MSTLFTTFLQNFNHFVPLEQDFTEVLESIALKPKMLYSYGKLPQNVMKNGTSVRPKTVAIVGSRRNTKYGKEVAYRIGYELAQKGVVIVSGLAYGIDSIGHRAALDAGGTTVAVLGNAAGRIHPMAHTGLAEEIVEKGGAIITEYVPDTPEYKDAVLAPGESIDGAGRRRVEHKTSFLYRNRLIAGLSDVVLVVEAAEQSGSLNTATHAMEQGKEVFAVPGNITSPYSQGCNKLITQGANPCTGVEDILRVLFPEEYIAKRRNAKKRGLIGDTDVETLILMALGNGLKNGDEIMATTKLPPEVFGQSITLLELKSRVRALGGNTWALN